MEGLCALQPHIRHCLTEADALTKLRPRGEGREQLMNDEEDLRPLVFALLDEANVFPTDVYPEDFHGLYDPSDERGADGELLLQFYAALAVLAREMHLHLLENPREDGNRFEQIIDAVTEEDRRRWGDRAFPLYRGLPGEALFLGLADAAATGRPTLEPLASPMLIREFWTRPGVLLFKRTTSALNEVGLRKRVCGRGGYYEQYAEHKIKAPELHALLVTSILTLSASAIAFWVPWAVLVSVTLVRSGLKRYCDLEKSKNVTQQL